MKNSKYLDISAVNQVIGSIYNNPSLLNNDKYFFNEEDFPRGVHRIIFGTIFNLYQQGVTKISLEAIEDYLEQRPKSKNEYKSNKGDEYLIKAAESSSSAAFDYYYNRLKKMALFRAYENLGIDLSDIYDPDNLLDSKKKQEQEDKIDNMSLTEIANKIQIKIDGVTRKYINNTDELNTEEIGEGLEELLESLKESPEFGYPLPGKYINTVTRGARLGKFYLRSASTGTGKTRSMAADCCFIGCSQKYDLTKNMWISIGECQPCVYISTEQTIDEIQTLMLAYISQVNEAHILDNEYFVGEQERVTKAIQILKNSKIKFISLPDFTMQQVEDTVKRSIEENNARYIFMDYLHSSIGILSEITKRSGGMKLAEYQVLFLLGIKLKDLAVKYQVFIESATQLSNDYHESETPDAGLLRGAKSLGDKIDMGMILLEVTEKDREGIAPICKKLGIDTNKINVKMSVYKARRGAYKGIYLWEIADRGLCNFDPQFATTWSYKIQEMPDIKIKVKEENAW